MASSNSNPAGPWNAPVARPWLTPNDRPAKRTADASLDPGGPIKRQRTPEPEQRLRSHQRYAPPGFATILRPRPEPEALGTPECPEAVVELAGTTGNIYTVRIERIPSCSCLYNENGYGSQCKHIIYVLSTVFSAKYEYIYQLALLPSELKEIIRPAPAHSTTKPTASADTPKPKKIEGDCNICYAELDSKDRDGVTWCGLCDQMVHKQCFEMWAAVKRIGRRTGGQDTCPYCQELWANGADVVTSVKRAGRIGDDGYVNVAGHLGLLRGRGVSIRRRECKRAFGSSPGTRRVDPATGV